VAGRLRVAIIDDHAYLRQVLTTVLGDWPELELVGDYGSPIQALAELPARAPDVVLMDLRMPELDGATATRQLTALLPQVRVMVLTAGADEEQTRAVLDAGACCVRLKESEPAELREAIRLCGQGDVG
jgi:two-component system, NarL family, response regulator DevR